MNNQFSQDWMEFYYDENWGVPDYPFSIKEFQAPTAQEAQPTVAQPLPAEAQVPAVSQAPAELKASILEKIPTWGWIAIGIGAFLFFTRKKR